MSDVSETARAALDIARHIHDEGYAGVIVSGGSHQVSRALLALGWNALYHGTRMPHQYVLDAEANALLYKRHAAAVYPHKFALWMERDLPELAAAKEDRLCFVDDFALSAEKYRGVGDAFQLLGFTHMNYAFFAALEDTELGRDAVVGERSAELVQYLRHMGQHIQGKEDVLEMLDEVQEEAKRLRSDAIEKLREIGTELQNRNK